MIYVLYTIFNESFCEVKLTKYLDLLSAEQQKKVLKFRRLEDQYRAVLGKVLIRKSLEIVGLPESLSRNIDVTPNGRPYIDKTNIDFNVSHSGGAVVCALSEDCRVGIDVEVMRKLDFEHYKKTMTELEWSDIYSAADPVKKFLKLWVIKESCLKANGHGLMMPLNRVHVRDCATSIEEEKWYYDFLNISSDYLCCVASSVPNMKVQAKKIFF